MKITPPGRTRSTRSPVARLTGAYRWYLTLGQTPLTYKEFAWELSRPLKQIGQAFTPATIQAWEKVGAYPSDEVLEILLSHALDYSWQYQFAQDMRAAIHPSTHQPASPLGKRILGCETHFSAQSHPGESHDQT
jgi:hypothetical protein